MSQKNYKPHYEHLKNKWTERHQDLEKKLWEKHTHALSWGQKQLHKIATGSLSGLLLLSPIQNIGISLPNVLAQAPIDKIHESVDKVAFLITDLSHALPDKVRPLTSAEEDVVVQTLSRHFGFPVSAELEGKRLNRSYGLIGAEQHLMRYPGDTMVSHFDPPAGGQEDEAKYYSSGMAPGRGAWGYFAPSRQEMTEKEIQREKYYIAVQTFLIPDYNERVAEYRDFLRFRKMLAVNPQNGQAMVVVIGDSGPAEWTGKHLGGSPEVMKYLERVDGSRKGPVLYFFIDDPKEEIPLGPVEVKS